MTKHFCDICGREIDTVKSKLILISFDGFYKKMIGFSIYVHIVTMNLKRQKIKQKLIL